MKQIVWDKIVIKIKSVIFKHIRGLDYKFFLFGSRVDGTFKERSDYDIGFISGSGKKLNSMILSDIQDDFDKIPALIDLIDFTNVSEDFKKIATKDIIWLNK